MDEKKKKLEKEKIIRYFWQQTENYIKLLQPKFYMPFAGRYVLAGKFSSLNSERSVAELEDAYQYFINSKNIEQQKHKCIILNSKADFNLDDYSISKKYTPIKLSEKEKYILEKLSKQKYDYEFDDEPSTENLISLISKAYERYENRRKEIGFSSETNIIIKISANKILVMSTKGNGYEICDINDLEKFEKFVKISLDLRLLNWLLKGPKYAHWNNAEIGSHLRYERNPEIYERGLYHSLSYFHA